MRNVVLAACLSLMSTSGALAAPGGKRAHRPKTPTPALATVKAEFEALEESGAAARVVAVRAFRPIRTRACVEYLDSVQKTEGVLQVRLECLRVLGQIGVSPAAERLLAVLDSSAEADAGAKHTALGALAAIRPVVEPAPFLRHLGPGVPLALRSGAVTALKSYPTADVAHTLSLILIEDGIAEPRMQGLRRAVVGSLRGMVRHEPVRGWLGERLGSPGALTPVVVELLELAGASAHTALTETLYPYLRVSQPAARAGAAAALGRLLAGRGWMAQETQNQLRTLLGDSAPDVVLAAAVALGEIGPSGDALEDVVDLCGAKAPGARALALGALERVKDPRVVGLARKGLGDKSHSVRAAAVATLRAQGGKAAVDALVFGLKKNKSGRLAVEVERALRELTGANPGDGYREWNRWWKLVREDFVFPKSGRVGSVKASSSGETRTRGAPTYYGSEIVSRRLTFVVDVSGSMTAQVQDAKGSRATRLAVCKRELTGVIRALSKRTAFNVIWFSNAPNPWQERLAPAGAQQKQAALEAVNALRAGGGTNVYDSLVTALADPSVDTIYLLSDGAPSSGSVTDTAEICRKVKRLNAARRVAIHTVSIGAKSRFMTRLAHENGGEALVR